MYLTLETYFKNKDQRQKRYLTELFSKIPLDPQKQEPLRKDMAILRASIIAELDAINLYEQLASETNNLDLKKVLLDVANEEKEHFGEFETLLESLDKDHEPREEKGEDEVEELTGKDY